MGGKMSSLLQPRKNSIPCAPSPDTSRMVQCSISGQRNRIWVPRTGLHESCPAAYKQCNHQRYHRLTNGSSLEPLSPDIAWISTREKALAGWVTQPQPPQFLSSVKLVPASLDACQNFIMVSPWVTTWAKALKTCLYDWVGVSFSIQLGLQWSEIVRRSLCQLS